MTLTYRIDVMDTVRKVQKWATTASNAIDSEDGRLVEQVDIINVLLSKNILKSDQTICRDSAFYLKWYRTLVEINVNKSTW